MKNCSYHEVKRNKTLSKSITSEIIARSASSANAKLKENSKTPYQRRHTIVITTTDCRSTQPKEESKVHLNEQKAGKRPLSSVVTQPELEGQNEKPVGSFWTTMAEEDEQRLFTERVNKTFSECLHLINEVEELMFV